MAAHLPQFQPVEKVLPNSHHARPKINPIPITIIPRYKKVGKNPDFHNTPKPIRAINICIAVPTTLLINNRTKRQHFSIVIILQKSEKCANLLVSDAVG